MKYDTKCYIEIKILFYIFHAIIVFVLFDFAGIKNKQKLTVSRLKVWYNIPCILFIKKQDSSKSDFIRRF